MKRTQYISASALFSGFTAKAYGGDFWEGARQGATSSALNHLSHSFSNDIITQIENRQQAQNGGVDNVSQAGLNFIAQYEGFSSTVYKVDGRGNPTIGFGHELLSGESFPNGITREQGLDLLKSDAQVAVSAINRYVTTPLSQTQFDATVSYVFNAGSGNTLYNSRRGPTKFLSNLNSGNFRGAASQMDINTSGGVFMRGLQNRRMAEQNLFLNGKYR